MFERFTERARQVVVLSQDAARQLKRDHIQTEHILLGVIREEEGLGSRVLTSLGVTDAKVLEALAADDPNEETPTGQVPFTHEAKSALELALREALSLGHNYIGTEHILLGLIRRSEDRAAQILLALDADSEKVRREVIRMLSGPSAARPRGRIVPEAHRFGRSVYGVYVGALASEAANHRYAGPAPVAWEFLSESEQRAWTAVGLGQQEPESVAVA